MVLLLGKQGQWIARLAFGFDDREVIPYRPEDAKSIGREITFQKDVTSYELLRDVFFLLSLCVEHRMKQAGLHGKGITLKVTYADRKGVTRSRSVFSCDSAVSIYREAAQMLEQIEKQPVRLIGVGIYNLSAEAESQMCLEKRHMSWKTR